MSILFSHFLSNHNEIRPQEADFTEVLRHIAVVPKMLYFYGKMPENRVLEGAREASKMSDLEACEASKTGDFEACEASKTGDFEAREASKKGVLGAKKGAERPKTVAIVGTRKPTAYGQRMAYDLAFAAAQHGAVVVSGLAYGVDAAAHRGALDAGGVTVAVLGTPIDQIYPRAHERLAAEIVEKGGAVLSELPPGAKYHPKTCFLERNRLIAGLADGVIIPEAAERSGSLNTAAHALEQGREVWAVPGDVTRPMSVGCNRLIRQGATPCLGVQDFVEAWFPAPRNRGEKSKLRQAALTGDTDAETGVLRLLAAGVECGEEVMERLKLSASGFGQTITMLELKGRVRALGCNRWAIR